MTKTTKSRKKSKSKGKKSSTKTKTKSSNIMKSKTISGAPEKDLHEISQTQQYDPSNDAQMESKHFEKLVKKCLKVKHLEYEGDKAIRKSKRSVNKLKKQKGSPEEIQEAKDILNQALLEKEEAEAWLDPQTAIEKLTLILEEQILAKVDNEQIRETTKSLEEAKESLEIIRQGEKDALFFKFDPIVETPPMNSKEDESMESNSSINLIFQPFQLLPELHCISHKFVFTYEIQYLHPILKPAVIQISSEVICFQ